MLCVRSIRFRIQKPVPAIHSNFKYSDQFVNLSSPKVKLASRVKMCFSDTDILLLRLLLLRTCGWVQVRGCREKATSNRQNIDSAQGKQDSRTGHMMYSVFRIRTW